MDNTLYSQITIQAPIEFGYIFSDEDRVSIESVLCQCSREKLINLAVLLNRNYCNKPALKLCEMLSPNDPRREELKNRIELFFQRDAKQNVEYVVCFETTSLELLRHAFSIPFERFDKTDSPSNIDQLQFEMVKLITQINEETMRYSVNQENRGSLSSLLYVNAASYWDILYYNPQNEYIFQVVQATTFFKLIEVNAKYDVLLNGFYGKYSISNWREYLRTLVSLFGLSLKGEGRIKANLEIDVDSLITRSVLDQLSISSSYPYISYASEDEYDKGGNSDYRLFRDKPLFKFENGDYLIHSRPLLAYRMFSSLYFDFLRISEELEGQPNIANLFTSEFIEKTLFIGLMNECLSSDIIDALDEEGLKLRYKIQQGYLGYPDYFLKTEDAIIFFECKDIRINAWIKEQRNYTIIENELRNKLVSKTYQLDYTNHRHREIPSKRIGCGQIAGHVANIRKNCFPWDSTLTQDIKVYPVLVVADNRLVAPGLAKLLQVWYAECLQEEELDKSSEYPLILMSPLTLIKYSSLFQQEGFEKYFDGYYRSLRSKPVDIISTLNNQISFDEFMSQHSFYLQTLGKEIIKELMDDRDKQ